LMGIFCWCNNHVASTRPRSVDKTPTEEESKCERWSKSKGGVATKREEGPKNKLDTLKTQKKKKNLEPMSDWGGTWEKDDREVGSGKEGEKSRKKKKEGRADMEEE